MFYSSSPSLGFSEGKPSRILSDIPFCMIAHYLDCAVFRLLETSCWSYTCWWRKSRTMDQIWSVNHTFSHLKSVLLRSHLSDKSSWVKSTMFFFNIYWVYSMRVQSEIKWRYTSVSLKFLESTFVILTRDKRKQRLEDTDDHRDTLLNIFGIYSAENKPPYIKPHL